MSKRIKNWTTDNTKLRQMFNLVNTDKLMALNNKLATEINTLEEKKEQDFGDIWSEPEDYDEEDRKEYFALCKKITNTRAEYKKLMLHMSGLAEMISDYQKKQKQEKKSDSE